MASLGVPPGAEILAWAEDNSEHWTAGRREIIRRSKITIKNATRSTLSTALKSIGKMSVDSSHGPYLYVSKINSRLR